VYRFFTGHRGAKTHIANIDRGAKPYISENLHYTLIILSSSKGEPNSIANFDGGHGRIGPLNPTLIRNTLGSSVFNIYRRDDKGLEFDSSVTLSLGSSWFRSDKIHLHYGVDSPTSQ